MKVILEHRRADAIIKTGKVSAMILVERVEVTTPLGWGMYIKPAHTDTFFLIGGEGPQYAIADVVDMLGEAERLGAESCLVRIDRDPPTWMPTYGYRPNSDEPAPD
ncbi:MAG TPA: hypothetical protein VGR35_06850 [Tepidisphaeraceae bacterium]|nr:hypothetical protein [Tepidisphaeraceae bacterium]